VRVRGRVLSGRLALGEACAGGAIGLAGGARPGLAGILGAGFDRAAHVSVRAQRAVGACTRACVHAVHATERTGPAVQPTTETLCLRHARGDGQHGGERSTGQMIGFHDRLLATVAANPRPSGEYYARAVAVLPTAGLFLGLT
jgi:hypothetical protein